MSEQALNNLHLKAQNWRKIISIIDVRRKKYRKYLYFKAHVLCTCQNCMKLVHFLKCV